MLLSIPFLLLLGLTAQAPAPDTAATVAVPLVGAEVMAVIHVDLNRIDFRETLNKLAGSFAGDKEVSAAITSANTTIDSLKKAGASELFIIVDPTEFPKIPLFTVTLRPGTDPKPLQGLIKGLLRSNAQDPTEVEVIGNQLVGGPPRLVAFARNGKHAPRADLLAAFAASGDSPAKVLIIPSELHRKAIEEAVTTLPRELGGGPVMAVTQGLAWGTLLLTTGKEPGLKLLIHAKDAATAGQIASLLKAAKTYAAERAKSAPRAAFMAGPLEKITPETKGDQVVMEMSPGLFGSLLIGTAQNAGEANRRITCRNNLKQIGLAMHNFHDAKKAFPPQATADKAGKPLLSWRVQILPFLDQQALYNEFHHDEPWDSPHNKALISRMPAVFTCPSGKHTTTEGKTCYLVPNGERTVLSGKQGGRIQDVLDGTSRTIMVAEMGDDAAVIWTKPDDWQIGNQVDIKPLLGHHPGGTNILCIDGAVHFIKDTIKQTLLKALITRDGGEVISSDAF